MTLSEASQLTSYSQSNKDLPLKLKTKLFFEALGYVCQLEVQVADKNYAAAYARTSLTDFDVLGFSFQGDFAFRRIAAECKSADREALSELLKLRGILDVTGIDSGYLVKSTIHQNTRLISNRSNISCVDSTELDALLKAWRIRSEQLDRELEIYARKRAHDDSLLANKQVARWINYLRYEYWNVDSFRNIHNLLSILRTAGDSLDSSEFDNKLFFYDCLFHLVVSLLRMCRQVFNYDQSDVYRSLQLEIFGGARERRDREGLIDQFNREILREEPAQKMDLDPSWLPDIAEVLARWMRSPFGSTTIPQLCCGLVEFSLENQNFRYPEIKGEVQLTALKLLQDLCIALAKNTGIKPDVFEELLAL